MSACYGDSDTILCSTNDMEPIVGSRSGNGMWTVSRIASNAASSFKPSRQTSKRWRHANGHQVLPDWANHLVRSGPAARLTIDSTCAFALYRYCTCSADPTLCLVVHNKHHDLHKACISRELNILSDFWGLISATGRNEKGQRASTQKCMYNTTVPGGKSTVPLYTHARTVHFCPQSAAIFSRASSPWPCRRVRARAQRLVHPTLCSPH